MSCICDECDHSLFDKIVEKELKTPIYISEIVNDSYCVSIDLNIDENFLDITLDQNEILSILKNKMGIYHLWINQDSCGDHFDERMLCVYVGKGYAHQRIKSHIKDKWVKDEELYITFYECSNRIAKYLEQLFLDNYKFHLNKEENTGEVYLQTMWDTGRFLNGSELHEHADMLAIKNPEVFNP